jgi:tRNA (guanine-N7-)-methyltransferase
MSAERTPTQPTADQATLRQRPIRSFVLRQGKMTDAQKRAFEQHWDKYGLQYAGGERDFAGIFRRRAELVLEIGFGNGEQLAFAAGNEPQRDFIGVEVHGPGVGRLLNTLAEAGADNVRVYQHDAVEVLREEIADGALDEVRIYFPDPWHKKKHNKRRLVNPAFVAMLCDKLRPGGLLHLATDWQAYAEQMLEVCEAQPRLRNEAGAGATVPRPQWRRQTHFETRGQKLGHDVWDLLYRRT